MYVVIVTLLSVVGAVVSQCPSSCSCRTTEVRGIGTAYVVACEGGGLRQVPDLNSLVSEKKKRICLHLKNNQITLVSQSSFPPALDVVQVILGGNTDLQLEYNAFVNLANSLLHLDLNNTNLQFKSKFSFLKGLTKLNTLILNGNRQNDGHIKAELFNNLDLKSLETLSLAYCNINDLTRSVFKGLSSVKELNLSNNNLANAPLDLALENLETLILAGNRISRLALNSFSDYRKLETLSLDGNHITFEIDALSALVESLSTVSCSSCMLDDVPKNAIYRLAGLTKLVLRNNPMRSIDVSSFSGTYCLEELDFSENIIPLHPKMLSKDSNCLTKLRRSSCGLTEIPTAVIKELTYLRSLDLSRNHIKFIERNAFPLRNLHEVDLSENPLTEIRPGAFGNPSGYYELNLDKTKLNGVDFLLEYDRLKFTTVTFRGVGFPCTCDLNKMLSFQYRRKLFGECSLDNIRLRIEGKGSPPALKDYCRTSTTSTTSTTTASENDNKKSTSAGAVVAVLVVILVLAGAASVFVVMRKKQKAKKNENGKVDKSQVGQDNAGFGKEV